MMSIDRVLKNPRLTAALTGLTPEEFVGLLPTFAAVLENKMKRDHNADPDKERAFGGGRKGFLPTAADKLFFILLYYKCYPTYDLLSFLFDCDRSCACRRQFYLSGIMEKTLGKKLTLPERRMKRIEDFFAAFPEAREVFVDGTERPIQRPKEKEKQKANYSGKKKRHTRKNLIITTKDKRIGFLSKTVEGKQHDFTMLKSLAPPDRCIPKNVKVHADLGFKGYHKLYPDHQVSMPERKPRTKGLSKTVQDKNKKKSSVRVLVEHAIGGIKRLNVVSQVYRNKVKDFDDKVMLVSCGLWNYHLAAR
jgi:hypothetical protein